MGRRPSIDRESVLDAAERVIASGGGAALTIDAVAKAAGVSKGGVQSCFGSKELMVSAMLDRWTTAYEGRLAAMLCGEETPVAAVDAHVSITEHDTVEALARAASLMAALLQHPEHLGGARQWYQDRLRHLGNGPEEKDARLAFYATEGAFLLRFLGLMPMTDADWTALFEDIRSRLLPERS